MEWEDKGKMVQLGNAMNNSIGAKIDFHKFCIDHIPKFDGQSWDMFCNIIQIIPEQMQEDIEFWKKVWPHLKGIYCNDEKFGLRSGMRIAMIQTVCEETLKFK